MGAEKGSARGGGAFFNLFDWNRKSRRKLFADEIPSLDLVSPLEKTKEERVKADILSNYGDDVDGDARGVKGGVIQSCRAPLAKDEGNGMKAPGVVARLMGLDFLPAIGSSDACCTSTGEPRCSLGCCYLEGCSECEFSKGGDGTSCKTEICSCECRELKHQKVPSSPMERFRMEMLPPKSVKSFRINHCKLLSPINTPYLVSSDSATHVLEDAAKILESRGRGNPSSGHQASKLSHKPLIMRDEPQCMATPGRPSKIPESSLSMPIPNGVKLISSQCLSKSLNSSEGESRYSASSVSSRNSSIGAKSNVKSSSLVLQAKANIQIKDGSRTAQSDPIISQTFKRQLSYRKHGVDRKGSSTISPSILKQNNQKQNTLVNKGMLADRVDGVRQMLKKSNPGEDISVNTKSAKNIPASYMVHSSKECQIPDGFSKEVPGSGTISYSRQKISGGQENQSNKISTRKSEKRIQHNIIIDETLKPGDETRRDGVNVVSFTFTSPLSKSTSATLSPARRLEEEERSSSTMNGFLKGHIDTESRGSLDVDLKEITGDALSRLLEQKLQQLTSELESSQTNYTNAKICQMPASQSSHSSSEITKVETELVRETNCSFDKGCFCHSFDQGSSSVDFCCWSSACNSQERSTTKYSVDEVREPDTLQHSPFFVLGACFSNETGESDNSLASVGLDFSQNMLPIEAESRTKLSLLLAQSMDEESEGSISCGRLHEEEINYVREILSASQMQDEDFLTGCSLGGLDPPILYHPEGRGSNHHHGGVDKDSRLNGKVLFDCVRESLDLFSSRHLKAGFWSWARGEVLLRGNLAEKLHKVISRWRRAGEWMVDELVEKDMSSQLGRWVNFEVDAFEAGVEIQQQISNTLIEEIVAEFLTESYPDSQVLPVFSNS